MSPRDVDAVDSDDFVMVNPTEPTAARHENGFADDDGFVMVEDPSNDPAHDSDSTVTLTLSEAAAREQAELEAEAASMARLQPFEPAAPSDSPPREARPEPESGRATDPPAETAAGAGPAAAGDGQHAATRVLEGAPHAAPVAQADAAQEGPIRPTPSAAPQVPTRSSTRRRSSSAELDGDEPPRTRQRVWVPPARVHADTTNEEIVAMAKAAIAYIKWKEARTTKKEGMPDEKGLYLFGLDEPARMVLLKLMVPHPELYKSWGRACKFGIAKRSIRARSSTLLSKKDVGRVTRRDLIFLEAITGPFTDLELTAMESRLKRLLLDNRLPAGDNNSDWNEYVFYADNFDVIRDAFDKVFNEARAHEYTRVYEECVAERDLARDRREQARLSQLSIEERAREAVQAGLDLAAESHARRTAEAALARARQVAIQMEEEQRLAQAAQALHIEQAATGVENLRRDVDELRRDLAATTSTTAEIQASITTLGEGIREDMRRLTASLLARFRRRQREERVLHV